MSATPSRRITRLAVVGLALVAFAGLTGCTGTQRDASNYAGTEDNFIDGCTSRAEQDSKDIADGEATGEGLTEIADPEDYCQCVFDAIKKDIPFDEFKKINSELRDEGGALPEDFVAAYDSCKPEGNGEK